MEWNPTEDEKKHLTLICGMCFDCIEGHGTENKKTFLANLQLIAEAIQENEDG